MEFKKCISIFKLKSNSILNPNQIFSILTLVGVSFSLGCSHSRCRGDIKGDVKSIHGQNETASAGGAATVSSSTNGVRITEMGDAINSAKENERVFVYKPDGSLQCGMGKAITLSQMKKELGSIQTYSAANKSDGMMRIQLCGSPTGSCNVFEINKKDLDAALALGFKNWTF